MANWIKKYRWILLILLIVFPFLLNFIVICYTPFDLPVAGEPKDWLTFWGSYISGAATICVLIVTIKHQYELNEMQKRILKHSLEKEKINTLMEDINFINKTSRVDKLEQTISENNLKINTTKYKVEVKNLSIYFMSRYMSDITKRKIYQDYYDSIQCVYEQFNVCIKVSSRIFKLNLESCLSVQETKKIINEQLKKKISDKEINLWNTIYSKMCSNEDCDDDFKKIDDNKLYFENIKQRFYSIIIEFYSDSYRELWINGAKLLRIEKQNLNNIILNNNDSITTKSDDKDIPF